jgi:hypothetical protein
VEQKKETQGFLLSEVEGDRYMASEKQVSSSFSSSALSATQRGVKHQFLQTKNKL